MNTGYIHNSPSKTIQYWQYPCNITCLGKFNEWKYFKKGIIIDHNASTRYGTKCFHYINSKNKETFRTCIPGFEAKNILETIR